MYGSILCRITGYIEVTLFSISVREQKKTNIISFSHAHFMPSLNYNLLHRCTLSCGSLSTDIWVIFNFHPHFLLHKIKCFIALSLLNFLAVRKPLRYETVQTKTRCQCWMCFTWISAAMLCCPSLWTEEEPTFDKYAYICVPNWQHMAAYSVTLGETEKLSKSFNL